jgi:hypothetical protein
MTMHHPHHGSQALTASLLLHPSSGPQQCPSHLHSIQPVHHAGMQAFVQTYVMTHATAPDDTDRGRGVPPVIDRPTKATFALPVSARAWCPSIGSRRPSSWPVSALPVRHVRRRVLVRPPDECSCARRQDCRSGESPKCPRRAARPGPWLDSWVADADRGGKIHSLCIGASFAWETEKRS